MVEITITKREYDSEYDDINYIDLFVIKLSIEERDYVYNNIKNFISPSDLDDVTNRIELTEYIWVDFDFKCDDPRSDHYDDYRISPYTLKDIITELILEWKKKEKC